MIGRRTAAAIAAAVLLLLGARTSRAAAPIQGGPVTECPTAGVRAAQFGRATGGEQFAAADGSEIRLAGIHSPQALSERAQAALTALLRGRSVMLAFTGPERDRYGRFSAQVFADGIWVQGTLLRDGMVLAAPDIAGAPCSVALLAAEASARTARAGYWRSGTFDVMSVELVMVDAQRRAGSFQLVEGTVLNAAIIGGRAYLNFGADYRSDFTVTIAPGDMREFRRLRFDPRLLAGKRIRVRGWLELFNGPNMQIATPAAIELLGE